MCNNSDSPTSYRAYNTPFFWWHLFTFVRLKSFRAQTRCHSLCLSLCVFRCGLKTAVPSVDSSSSRAQASLSPVPPRRRPLHLRSLVSLIPSQTHLAPTARPLPSRVPPWPPALVLATPQCPSGAQPSRPSRTPWPHPRPPACSGPLLTPWVMARHRPTARATPAPPPTSQAWTVVPTCRPCTRSCQGPVGPWAPSLCPPWGAPWASPLPHCPHRATAPPAPWASPLLTAWTTRTSRPGNWASPLWTAWTTKTKTPGSSKSCRATSINVSTWVWIVPEIKIN